MRKVNIAIDGYSSCGKSTLAKQLARELKYIYVDSGAMYRAVALYGLRIGAVEEDHLDKDVLVDALSSIEITFRINGDGEGRTILNGEDVEDEIRGMMVSKVVSLVSTIPEVREKLVELQKKMGADKGVVMDGRDIGTVVFPDAELKIFMKADPEVRARRRYDELKSKGMDVTLEEIVANIRKRDHNDENREHDPLRLAEDAFVLDNTNVDPKGQFERALELAKSRMA